MVKVQIDLSKDLNKKIENYKLDNDLLDKRVAITKMLEEFKV